MKEPKRRYLGVRIDDSLHATLHKRAKENDRSLSGEVNALLKQALGMVRAPKRGDE